MGKVKKTLDKALEAIDAGKKEEAKAYVVQMANDARFSHDGMCSSLAQFLAFIANKNGEEAVYEVFRDSAEDFWKTAFMSLKDDPKKLFDLMVQAWRGHVSDFTLQEDDQKFTLVLHCCGSGGVLRKERKTAPPLFGTTKKRYPWSFNQKGIPYYCAHCAIFFNILPKEWGVDIMEHRFGRQFDKNGNPVDKPCKNIVYKKPRS